MTTFFLVTALALVDFSKQGHGWIGNSYTPECRQSEAGFHVVYQGIDPWITGPKAEIPYDARATKLALDLKADANEVSSFTVFYRASDEGFSESRKATLCVTKPGVYHAVLPYLHGAVFLRIDPPGGTGEVVFHSLSAEPIFPLYRPAFVSPSPVQLNANNTLHLKSGHAELVHRKDKWDAFSFTFAEKPFAEANGGTPWGYMTAGGTKELDFSSAKVTHSSRSDEFSVYAEKQDADGVEWRLSRRFTAAQDAIRMEMSLSVSADRQLLHAPWLTLFSGRGTFGEKKSQALLPGVEYLANEPSSNEKEIRGAEANRKFVMPHKVCYPLLSLSEGGLWFSAGMGSHSLSVSPLFDSPDRLFRSGGHVMGFWSPGADGEHRHDSEFAVYKPVLLRRGETYTCVFTLAGGKGEAVTEAMADYVRRNGLPSLPEPKGGFSAAVALLSAGWLDSNAMGTNGISWRHAVGNDDNYKPVHAEEIPAYLLWLASHTKDKNVKKRLTEKADQVIASFPAHATGRRRISHIARPVNLLLYGNVAERVKSAAHEALDGLKSAADGTIPYTPGETDYSALSGTNVFNGFTAMCLADVCENISLTGDETAITAFLRVLDRMTERYAGEVPRGAQPWEMPLHTPDIVASGRLVRLYTLGYLFSKDPKYLKQARYWAWTGFSMIYLVPPSEGEIGVYSTTGVIGATNWTAPNWIGLPVQWCGLLYAATLHELAAIDETPYGGVWRKAASGIVRTGVQMSYPFDDPERLCGLLPDSVNLPLQMRNGPAINPGTVQMCLGEAYGQTPVYSLSRLSNGSLIHVPGEVRETTKKTDATPSISFHVNAWPERPYRIILTRLSAFTSLSHADGRPLPCLYLPEARTAILTLTGSQDVTIRFKK